MVQKNWKSISLVIIALVGSTVAVAEYGRINVLKGELVVKVTKLLVVGLLLSQLLVGGEVFGATASDRTQSNSAGGVTVKVTFLDAKTSGDLRFRVALDTHSVDLDSYDLKKIAVLRDETGKTLPPTSVDNKGSGHHRQVTVVFPNTANSAKRLELVIKDLAGVKERIFRWDLQ